MFPTRHTRRRLEAILHTVRLACQLFLATAGGSLADGKLPLPAVASHFPSPSPKTAYRRHKQLGTQHSKSPLILPMSMLVHVRATHHTVVASPSIHAEASQRSFHTP
ncbi:uncharacterized protein BCR38DRAFT_38599 [Pseudomassariella vexata]|uniref:Secreted protein n=1 Tax=Pseudomassariella vexata TaxID=1141098 RepID=A0A1Y2DSR4_9PEZI|nr:uncharacterized protein BCR38DRAFT_38599 [Pseudomassariella vexata]ORY61705.1 hypothetical protein BCR38DRAFT_38599 [Pseudomassariella vexata]